MDEEKYKEELDKLFQEFSKNFGLLQEELTDKEILEYAKHIEVNYIVLLTMMVGKEQLLHYLINLLNNVSKMEWNNKNLSKKSRERYNRIKKENKKPPK